MADMTTKLFFECVETQHNLNYAVLVLVELDRILDDMKENLLINVPVRARPTWHLIALDYLDFNLFVLNLVVKRGEKFQDHLAKGLGGDRLELADQHLCAELCVGHLTHQHVRHDLRGAPYDPSEVIRLFLFVVELGEELGNHFIFVALRGAFL